MRIVLNGEAREIEAATLAAALDELGYQDAVVATALNREFVPREARGETRLLQGDRIEVIAPMKGG